MYTLIFRTCRPQKSQGNKPAPVLVDPDEIHDRMLVAGILAMKIRLYLAEKEPFLSQKLNCSLTVKAVLLKVSSSKPCNSSWMGWWWRLRKGFKQLENYTVAWTQGTLKNWPFSHSNIFSVDTQLPCRMCKTLVTWIFNFSAGPFLHFARCGCSKLRSSANFEVVAGPYWHFVHVGRKNGWNEQNSYLSFSCLENC